MKYLTRSMFGPDVLTLAALLCANVGPTLTSQHRRLVLTALAGRCWPCVWPKSTTVWAYITAPLSTLAQLSLFTGALCPGLRISLYDQVSVNLWQSPLGDQLCRVFDTCTFNVDIQGHFYQLQFRGQRSRKSHTVTEKKRLLSHVICSFWHKTNI